MSENELIARVSALAERSRRLAYPTHPPIFIEVAEELELFAAVLRQALAERDEARGTSRKLNREKQQLESDIAHNRDIIAEFHAGSDMDRAYLSLHRERAELRANVTRLTAALSAETEACPKPLPLAFITCTSARPDYYVTIKTNTLREAQSWHDAVLLLAARGRG